MLAIEMIFNGQPTELYLTNQRGDHGERLWGDNEDAAAIAEPLPDRITLAFTRKTAHLSRRGQEPCWRHGGNGRLAARLVEHPRREQEV
jgi:hypothetical protein